MKTKESIDAISFVAIAGVLTTGVAVLSVVQAAAAGLDLLVVLPFARSARTIKAKTAKASATAPRSERRLPQAA